MNNEDGALIQGIRDHVNAERRLIAEVEAKINHPSMKPLLKRASDTLDDVESVFLRGAEKEPRSSDGLRKWLSGTPAMFTIAEQQRKVVEDAIANYGPDVMAFYPD
jgi:hypothetical protein